MSNQTSQSEKHTMGPYRCDAIRYGKVVGDHTYRRNEAAWEHVVWHLWGVDADGQPTIVATMYRGPDAESVTNAMSAHTEAVKRLVEAAKNAVPMMEMTWRHKGVGGVFECMAALRAALTAYQQSVGGSNA